MSKLLTRPLVYLAEAGFCFRTGVRLRDKLALLFETAWFHIRHNRPGRTLEAAVHIGPIHPHLKLRRYGGDIFIFHEVLRCGVYDFPTAILQGTGEVRVIVDLGAHIGLTTLKLKSRYPQARVVCVEPHPENAELLRHNLQCLGDSATILEAAVSNTTEAIQLVLATEHYNASLVRTGGEAVTVSALTMDDIMRRAGIDAIDVLKMDIEGAELPILEGRPAWLKKVRVLLAELHGPRQDEMQVWLREMGFQVECDGSQITAWRQPA